MKVPNIEDLDEKLEDWAGINQCMHPEACRWEEEQSDYTAFEIRQGPHLHSELLTQNYC